MTNKQNIFAGIRSGVVVIGIIFLLAGNVLSAETGNKIYIPRKVTLHTCPDTGARVDFGVERLSESLSAVNMGARIVKSNDFPKTRLSIVVGTIGKSRVIDSLAEKGKLNLKDAVSGREGFVIQAAKGQVVVAGNDDSGTLYGCLELASRIKNEKKLPRKLYFSDAPKLQMRGTCIAMQKTEYLPGRKVYEYPYTPETFPFFYDKEHWKEYLDFLVENRMNALYLWNGHPFASLVKLDDYPYAVEVSEETFARNVEMYNYITTEADKRGIWVIQMFYNIFVSKPFAEKHRIDTQHRESSPLVADYTRKSITEFVKTYPNVGLLVCLGEALTGRDNQLYWLKDVIIPGVKDGLNAMGKTEEPPIIIRAHHIEDNIDIVSLALPRYRNLYTMTKFNGESLTTFEERGRYQRIHKSLSNVGSMHIVNVHLLSNLEPFRYGAVRFIKNCVQSFKPRLGASGLQLYPLAYWDWPNVPDKNPVLSTQIERDWIWFEAWAYYAWNPDRATDEDRSHWISRLKERYGTWEAAQKILAAYNDSGECAPRILRRFGITGGNRQTMSLGMTLHQLTDPNLYRPWIDLWKSDSPPGERLHEYVKKEWQGKSHVGETPPQIIEEIEQFSAKAVEAIDAAAPYVTKNKAEFERLRNDMYCIRAMSLSYCAKAKAAMHVLRYRLSGDIEDLRKAAAYLKESFTEYQKLAALTEDTYRYAQTLQTPHRKIPIIGSVEGRPVNYHWTQLVDMYQKEIVAIEAQVDFHSNPEPDSNIQTYLAESIFEILGGPDKPVVDQRHPDAYDIVGGFEGGRALKLGDTYHMFPTERAGIRGRERSYDRIKTRIGHWVSKDALNWKRLAPLYQASGKYTYIKPDNPASDRRASLWAFMPVFNEKEDRWNGFYVAYTCNPEIDPVHCFGRIWRSVSKTPGIEGIGGPYEDVSIIIEPGLQSYAWEGRQGVDSFFPYQVGDKWYGFYGGAFPFEDQQRIYGTRGKWHVGLAEANEPAGPWFRMGPDMNPVTSIHPTFLENPIVTQLPDGTYIAMFDGGPLFLNLPNMFGYSLSRDGINWSNATYFPIRTKVKRWWQTMRTPLGLIPEGDNIYTIIYTAWKPGGRFHPIGMVRVKLRPTVLAKQVELLE
ncbi:MAG: alpha-glucuronidase family glycosyl hydrolase [Planctomycetota bacterium]|jgi:hypothetical protein